MTEHYLKTIEPYFSDVKNGLKTFEVRKNDRNFEVGDKIYLLKYHPYSTLGYVPESITAVITYILNDCNYCKYGYIIFGIKVIA